MAVTPTSTPLSGLSRRLVQDGIVGEEAVVQALQASRAEPGGLVPYLVSRNLADSRQVAIAAGAIGEQIERIAAQMVSEGNVRAARARELVGGAGGG